MKYKRDDGERVTIDSWGLICPKCGGPSHPTGKMYQFWPCPVCGVIVSNCGLEHSSHRRKHEREGKL